MAEWTPETVREALGCGFKSLVDSGAVMVVDRCARLGATYQIVRKNSRHGSVKFHNDLVKAFSPLGRKQLLCLIKVADG